MASEKCGLRRRNGGHRVLAVHFLSVILVFAFLFLIKGQTVCAADLRTVRVGYYPVTNFQEHDEAGVYRGYSYDFLLAVAQYAGWQYEFVPVTYSQGIRMLEDGQLDLMNGVEKTEENGSRLGFSTLSSGSSWSCLVMKPADISVAYEDFDAIGKLTVGLAYLDTHNSAFVDYCKDHDCMPKLIYFHSDAEVRKALEKGKIDACVVSSMLDTGMREIAKFSNVDYYLAVTKGNTDLLDRLNAAMNEMKADDPYFEENIYALYHAKSGTGSLVLSEDEKQYIAENPAVTVTYIPDRYPISYRDRNGNFAGAIADISRELEQKTGLSFRYVSAGTYGEAMNLFASGDAEVMAGFPYDFKWALMKHAEVTSPFVTLSLFGVSRAGKEQGNTAGTSAGSYQEYLLASILREPYVFSGYQGAADCLKAVLHGDVSYTFLDSYQIEYYNRRADYRALTYKAIPGAEYRLSFGVSDRADPRLRSILDKALVSTGTDEIGEAFRRSVQTSESRSFVDFVYSNPRAAGFVFTLAGFLICICARRYFLYPQHEPEKSRTQQGRGSQGGFPVHDQP